MAIIAVIAFAENVKKAESFSFYSNWHLYKIKEITFNKANGVAVYKKLSSIKINNHPVYFGKTTISEINKYSGKHLFISPVAKIPGLNKVGRAIILSNGNQASFLYFHNNIIKTAWSFHFFANGTKALRKRDGSDYFEIAVYGYQDGKFGMPKNEKDEIFWLKKIVFLLGKKDAYHFLVNSVNNKVISRLNLITVNNNNIANTVASNNQIEAWDIIAKYTAGISYSCNFHEINGYKTNSCGSFVVSGSLKNGDYIVSQSLFSTQLKNELLLLLRNSGFANDTNLNLTTAFINYITPVSTSRKYSISDMRLFTIAGVSNMISNGYVKPFNELVNLFVKHFEKINR
jgi:hypothetical protein